MTRAGFKDFWAELRQPASGEDNSSLIVNETQPNSKATFGLRLLNQVWPFQIVNDTWVEDCP